MKLSPGVVSAVALSAVLVSAQTSDPSVDAVFKDFTVDVSPGCAAGATRDGRSLFAKGFGMADLEHRIALTPQSVFYMASVSKQFTALAILLLEQNGTLQLDDPVRRYVPELPEHAASITLRQLLHHTSGLRDYLTLTSLAGRPADYVITEPIVLQTLGRQTRLNFAPGSEHLYSNSGYVLLSIVAQRVTGRRLNDWAREKIFLPLGMRSTRFQHDHTAQIPGRANGYVRANDSWRLANSVLDVVGDGGLYSTVDDMLRWATAFETPPFAGLLARMQTPGMLGDGRPIPNGYGMGLVSGSYRGLTTVSHGGSLVGYRTVLLRFPEHKLTIVALCNNGTANPTRLAQRVADIHIGNSTSASVPGNAPGPPQPMDPRPVPRELGQALAGVFYSAELDASYRLFTEADQLRVEAGSRPPISLSVVEADRLRMPSGTELVPTRDATGTITGFALNAGRVRDLAFVKRGPQTSPRPEATALGGQPLFPPVDIPNRTRLEADLAQAEKDLVARPADADASIWVGRRQAYLWRFQEAIATYTKGLALHPANPKLLRHRGHRYITVRQFDRAIADFEKAAALIRGTVDQAEPDGAPNPSGKPRSTLHFNIWYHLGLAHYLNGDFAKAVEAYTECMKVSTNDDAVVATSDWLWMTLMRLNRTSEAAKVLERISPKMEILENASYHRRLQMYRGLEKPEALLDPAIADDLTIATQGYGVGNYFYVNGDRTRAKEIFEKVVSGRQWNAFGFIAAETDLQRMKQ